MEKPFQKISSLAASGTQELGVINLNRCRTFSVTGKCTYNSSGTLALRVHLYYSPDGKSYDTVSYAYFDVTITAGSAIQESHSIDMPEHGYMLLKLQNLDTSYAITNISIWYEIGSYPRDPEEKVN